MKKLALYSAIAAATMCSSASAFQFDINGPAAGGLVIFAPDIDYGVDNVLLTNVVFDTHPAAGTTLDAGRVGAGILPGTEEAFLLSQGFRSFDTNGILGIQPDDLAVSFVFSLPVNVTYDNSIVSGTHSYITTRDTTRGFGEVKLFLTATSNIDKVAGTGYTSGVELAAGRIVAGTDLALTMSDTQQDNLGNTVTYLPLGEGSSIQTKKITGAAGYKLDILTQNNAYVYSDLVNADIDFNFDINQNGPSFLAPFENTAPAALVNGVAPQYSLDNLQDETCAFDPFAPIVTALCDLHGETQVAMTFNDSFVPEPGTLGLAGLSLALAGIRMRRRDRKA